MAGTRLTHWICGIGLAVLAAGCSRTGDTPDSVPVEKSGLESTITSGSTTTSATTPAADVLPEADPPAIPLPHQAILDAMQKTRAVHFKDATLDECLQDLSKSLGVEIVLHEDLRKSLNDRRAGLGPTTSVSHLAAIQVTMRCLGFYNTGLMFEKDRVTVVSGDHPVAALRTIDLRSRADITLARRDMLIRQAVGSVQPESWGEEAETWIRPGESVFEVDAYQTPEVYTELCALLQPDQHPAIIDFDAQSLQTLPGLLPKGQKPIDKVAVVERLRKKYAYESLVERLDYESAARREPPKLSESAAKRLGARDKQFTKAAAKKMQYRAMRAESLRMLHEEEVATFVGKPGAGLARMPAPGPSYLPQAGPRQLPLAANDMLRPDFDVAVTLPVTQTESANRRVHLPSVESMQRYHFNSEQTFASAPSFGYIKGLDQVAGFNSHGLSFIQRISSFKRRPWYTKAKELWAIHRMELVSLLKHETPRVYVSRNVPRMEELREAEVRPLNDFEESSLNKLVEGEDVVLASTLNRIQMLGSLRATKQCQQCHSIEHGALLGAFSYEMLRDPQIDPREVPELDGNQALSLTE